MKFTDAPPVSKMANCTDYFYRVQTVDYCARDKNMNASTDLNKAKSTFFPAVGDNAIPGFASENATKPEAPTLFLESSSCTGGQCNLNLTWSPVSKDAGVTDGPPIYINRYDLTVERKVGLVWVPVPSWISIPIEIDKQDYKTTYTLQVLKAEEYRMYLVARDCVDSDKSPYLYFPCDFGSTTVDITLPDNYGGDGSSGSPWIIQPPASVTVKASATVSSIGASFYDNGTQVGSTATVNNPAGNTATFVVPTIIEGHVILARFTMTDAAGKCTVYYDRYLRDESPPACALVDAASDSSVIQLTTGKKGLIVTVKNKSAVETLTLQKVFLNWDIVKGETLASIDFPKTGGGLVNVPVNCSAPSGKPPAGKTSMITKTVVPATALVVPKSATTYQFTINFTVNKAFTSTDVLNSVCIQYKSSTGDLKTCALAPNAGSCTEPAGGNCQ